MSADRTVQNKLAILGGPKAVECQDPDLFRWPIVTEEDVKAVNEVLLSGGMSQIGPITRRFEEQWAEFQGTTYALGHCSGTAALMAAMFGAGIGRGHEVIAPSFTYWASCAQVMALGATPVLADSDPASFCIDPGDIEKRITSRTKAIIVVHLFGHPAEMDSILTIARKYDLKVIEDVSHAQGGLYKGRMVGSIGDVAGISMMTSKAFPIGEAGMLCTNDQEIYERAIAFGHYKRKLTLPHLVRFQGIPLGGQKFRINQACSAMGLVQLKYYPKRMKEIQDAMNRFWDLLEDVPGIRAHRTPKDSGSTMGGWFYPVGHYIAEELGGLPLKAFTEAVRAEGVARCGSIIYGPLHVHPVFNEADVYQDGKPTRIAFAQRDVREGRGSLPISEAAPGRVISVPYFKCDKKEAIEQHAAAFRKVSQQAEKLLENTEA